MERKSTDVMGKSPGGRCLTPVKTYDSKNNLVREEVVLYYGPVPFSSSRPHLSEPNFKKTGSDQHTSTC